jgi:hypothetical protein
MYWFGKIGPKIRKYILKKLFISNNNKTMRLSKTMGYHKNPIKYEGLEKIINCTHLGGQNARNRL